MQAAMQGAPTTNDGGALPLPALLLPVDAGTTSSPLVRREAAAALPEFCRHSPLLASLPVAASAELCCMRSTLSKVRLRWGTVLRVAGFGLHAAPSRSLLFALCCGSQWDGQLLSGTVGQWDSGTVRQRDSSGS
jgi:hypothetical protein